MVCQKSKGQKAFFNVHVSKNYKALLMLAHCLRNLGCIVKSILWWKWWITSVLSQLEVLLHKTKWKKKIFVYYGELIEIFQESNHCDKVVMKDPNNVMTYRRSIKWLRIHIFLVGLIKSLTKSGARFYVETRFQAWRNATLWFDKRSYIASL